MMTNAPSQYSDLAQLLAYLESTAETVRAQLRDLWRAEDPRKPARLAPTARRATAQHLRARRADLREARRGRGTSHAVLARRALTAQVLAQFDLRTPTRPRAAIAGLGALVRRGYLRRQGGGYLRTAKPFHVDPHASAGGTK